MERMLSFFSESRFKKLVVPVGLRSLSRDHPDYKASYHGDLRTRDAAYHQGTAWSWLLGPFVEGWLRVRGWTPQACALAKERFIAPMIAHLADAGLGHVSEIADADAPHTPRGCPFQAWSLGELLRLTTILERKALQFAGSVERERPVLAGR